MELVDKVHNNNLVRWAKDHPEALVLSGDLTGSTEIAGFRDAYPDRFVSMGMAEQNMVSWAGGLAREGYVPLLHTFAVFLYRRPLDQLSMSVCYPNLKVRLFGFLPGITTPGGVSHQAIDDLAVLRGVPNLKLIEVGDATDVETLLEPLHEVDGPVYIRMLRGRLPRLFPRNEPFRLNRARVLTEGDDLAILSSGVCTHEAMRAVSALRAAGLSITHLHVSTIKPFTDPEVVTALKSARHGVITFENHSIIGGLGSAVAEVMASNAVNAPLVRLGLQDTYAHGASQPYLMKKYGLDAIALVNAVEDLLKRKFGITEAAVRDIPVNESRSVAANQLEAL